MNLEQTALSLLEQFPAAGGTNLQTQERIIERFGQVAFGGFCAVILVAIASMIYLIFARLVLTGDNFWAGLLLIAFILFAGLTLTYVFLSESLKEKRAKHNPQAASPPTLTTPPVAGILNESRFEPIGSVTEHTTDLLGHEIKRKTTEL